MPENYDTLTFTLFSLLFFVFHAPALSPCVCFFPALLRHPLQQTWLISEKIRTERFKTLEITQLRKKINDNILC